MVPIMSVGYVTNTRETHHFVCNKLPNNQTDSTRATNPLGTGRWTIRLFKTLGWACKRHSVLCTLDRICMCITHTHTHTYSKRLWNVISLSQYPVEIGFSRYGTLTFTREIPLHQTDLLIVFFALISFGLWETDCYYNKSDLAQSSRRCLFLSKRPPRRRLRSSLSGIWTTLIVSTRTN